MKNLTIFRSTAGWYPDLENLNNNLSVPGNVGFAWRVLRDGMPYIRVGDNIFLSVEHQKKLIPSSVVNAELEIRSKKMAIDQCYRLSKKQKGDLKETIMIEFAAKAFVTSKLINIWINLKEDLLCIETASNSITEDIIPLLIRELRFTGRRLETENLPSTLMRALIIDGVEREFECGNNCVLKDIVVGSFISYKNEDLDTEVVENYVNSGKVPEKLEVVFRNESAFFTLDKNLVISQIVIHDEEICPDLYETAEDYFDAEFTIRSGYCVEIINALTAVLGEQRLIEEKDAA